MATTPGNSDDNPALRAAVLTAINSLQTASLIPSPMTTEMLVGAVMAANATCAAHTYEQVKMELTHVIQAGPVATTGQSTTRMGYTQAALQALS